MDYLAAKEEKRNEDMCGVNDNGFDRRGKWVRKTGMGSASVQVRCILAMVKDGWSRGVSLII